MASEIDNRYKLSTIFQRYGVIEVYSDDDIFLFTNLDTHISLLIQDNDVSAKLFYAITDLFSEWKVTLSTQPRNYLFHGKKLIWRKGQWYT